MPESPPGGEPVFVCGLARSGTTWLGKALGQSPELTYLEEAWLLERLGELVDWFSMLHAEWRGFTPWYERGVDRAAFVELLAGFYRDLLLLASGGERFVEKTPDWNLLHLRLLHELFPDAYYLLVYRDGRNYVASLEAMKRDQGEPFDFAASCRRWALGMEELAQAQASGTIRRLKVIRYEQLLEDFTSSFRDVCRFADVSPFEPVPHIPNTAFEAASGAEDFNRRWLAWSPREKAEFEELAGEQLRAWGYADPGGW